MDLFTYLMAKKGHKLSTNDEFSYLLGRGNQEYTTKIGTTIDVKGSINAPMTIELKPHELTQDDIPTSDDPQEIHVITGDNTIHVSNGKTPTNYPINLGSIEYSKIGDYQDNIFKSSGKNLIPTSADDWEQGSISGSTGENSSNTKRIRTKTYYPIQSGIDYHVSVQNTNYTFLNILLYDSTYTFIGGYYETISNSINGATNLTINIPTSTHSNVSYMRVTLRNADNTSVVNANDVEIAQPMLELGTVKTTFEPYGTNWFIKKEIGKYVIDTTQITLRDTYTNIDYAIVLKPDDFIGKGNYTRYPLYCSHAQVSLSNPSSWDDASNIGYLYSGANQNNFWIGFEKNTSLETIKEKLNGAIIYYPLKQSSYIQITDTTLIEELETTMNSKDKRTIITQTNDDLPFIIKATIKIK